MRIVFMGSASFSCFSLEAVAREKEFEIAMVVTQPERPKGRDLKPQLSPVGLLAGKLGLDLSTPKSIYSSKSLYMFKELKPDVLIVVAYGQILKRDVLGIPSLSCLNVHASLLPKYRGAAPIQWSIADGESVTGVTTMEMSEGVDEGDMFMQEEVTICPTDTGGSLHDKLGKAGAGLLVKTLKALASGNARKTAQDGAKATFARKLTKEDGRINWYESAAQIERKIRAFDPWPGSWCVLPSGERLKVLEAVIESVESSGVGVVVSSEKNGPIVSAGAGVLRLTKVQPEGRRVMSGGEFVRGRGLSAGTKLS